MDNIEILNVAESKCSEEHLSQINWKKMSHLKFLNARLTFMKDEVLHSVAVGCTNLTSLNLYGCNKIFHKPQTVNFTLIFSLSIARSSNSFPTCNHVVKFKTTKTPKSTYIKCVELTVKIEGLRQLYMLTM